MLPSPALPQKSHLARVGSILVRVGSRDLVDPLCFSGEKERSAKSHELNTKLVTAPIDFEAKLCVTLQSDL